MARLFFQNKTNPKGIFWIANIHSSMNEVAVKFKMTEEENLSIDVRN